MFDFGRITEFLLIAIAALILIGPKELPHVLYTLGRWLRKFQGLRDHLKQSMALYIQEGHADEYYQHINHAVLNEAQPSPSSHVEPSQNIEPSSSRDLKSP